VSDVGEYGILDRYLTKENVEHVMGFKTISGPLILIKCGTGTMWTWDLDSSRDKVWRTRGSQEFGD
jgi:hypothetical protein